MASEFIDYWFAEGYLPWTAIEPERKIPMRLGTPTNPQRYRDAWFSLPVQPEGPSLVDVYGREILEPLAASVSGANRWGFPSGHGQLMTAIYENFVFSTLLQEMLSGYFSSSQAAIEGYQRVVDLIPDYAYSIDPLPAPEELGGAGDGEDEETEGDG